MKQMKQIKILLLAVFAFTALTIQAEVLLVENFDYTTGSTLLEANSDWFHYWPNHDNTMLITDGGLSFAGYAGSDIGNALVIEGDHTSDEPYHKFTTVTEGDVFAAFMLKPTYVIKNGYVLTFCEENIGNFNNCGRVFLDYDYFEADDAYHPIIGSRVFKESVTYADELPLDENKTYLVVLRYRIVADGLNEVSLYLFDEMPTKLPSKPLIGPLTNNNAPDICPAHVGFHTWNSSYGEDGEVTVDGLRIATNFYEALGIDEPTDIDQAETATSRHFTTKLINGTIVITNGISTYNLLGTKL